MNAFDDFLDFLSNEIHFFKESRPPLRYEILCWIARIKPRHKAITEELEFVYREAHRTMIRLEDEKPKINRKELLEALARHTHNQWMEWSKTIAENECLSPARLKRWQGHLWKPYDELSDTWKEQDRMIAMEILRIVEDFYNVGLEQPKFGRK